MAYLEKCPHCGQAVSDDEDFCMHCFFDLRSASQASPQQTKATRHEQKGVDYPDTALEKKPRYDDGSEESESPPRLSGLSEQGSGGFEMFGDQIDEISQPPKAALDGTTFGTSQKPRPKQSLKDQAVPYRPILRPPMAVLYIHDDDMDGLDTIRLRSPEFTIGRTTGDLVMSHELLMSGEHARISRRLVDDCYTWYLTDLQSTNGTYMRVEAAKLPHNREFLIGAYRYRFNAAPQGSAAAGHPNDEAAEEAPRTLGWQKVRPDQNFQAKQSIIRITPDGETREFKFNGSDQTIGSDKSCDIFIGDDEMVSSKHARIYLDEHRRWHIEDNNSLNGTWIAIREKKIDMRAQFQIGEQRFTLRFP